MRTLPLALLCSTIAVAQNRTVVPAIAATLPGNAAVSMPLRWSQGVLQVLVDASLLPPGLSGQQLTGLRLRRPALLGEPAYAGVQRTLTVRAAFTTTTVAQVTQQLAANRPANLQVVAGPAAFGVPASAAPVPPATIGGDLLAIPFATPLPVQAGNLFLEFEATDAPLRVDEPWVDAVWVRGGVETGYVVPVGDAGCTTRSEPFELVWSGGGGPLRGNDATLVASGMPPGALAFAWFGLDPLARTPGAGFLGYGASLQALDPALASCRQWAPIDANWLGFAGAGGAFEIRFAVPVAHTARGDRIAVQSAFLDLGRPGALPLAVSNGSQLVLDSAGVDNRCVSVHFPATATESPWNPDIGLMPVLILEH